MAGDPLALDLNDMFHDRRMFRSADNWRHAGFELIREGDGKLLVAKHADAKGFLFKKYSDRLPLRVQLEKYTQRVEGANRLRQLIAQRNLTKIVVPNKWLYTLPDRFRRDGISAYIIIVERLSIFDDRENKDDKHKHDKSSYMHRNIDLDVLRELCVVWFECKNLDFTAMNAPFTKTGKVAFIDTGYIDWQDTRDQDKRKERFMKCADMYLGGERREFAKNQWKELSVGLR